MNRCVAASCGLVFVFFSCGFLSAQEEPARSEKPVETRLLEYRLEKLKDEAARQKKEIAALKKRFEVLFKGVTIQRQLLMNNRTAEHERVRRAAERHQAEERSRSAPVRASREQSTRTTKRFVLQEVRATEFAGALVELLQTTLGENGAVGIATNERDNRIEVTATQEQLNAIEMVIKAVDRPTDEESIRIFPLENANAPQLAEVIKDLFRQTRRRGEEALRIASDARTNSIIVIAPPEQLKKIEALLLSLDQPENKPNTDNNKTNEKSS